MEYSKEADRLSVTLIRDFNLYVARRIAPLASDAVEVRIDLGNSKIVDSEAVRMLHGLVASGKHITLIDPPDVFFEVLEILGLSEFFDLDAMVERTQDTGRKLDG